MGDTSIHFGDNEYQRYILKSLLLLTLAVSGNFIGSTLSCQVQYQMTNNVYVKHAILLFVIYLTLTGLDPKAGSKSPMYSIKNTLIIWGFYVMFTKQGLVFSTIAIALLAISYIADQFATYYEKRDGNLSKVKTRSSCFNIIRDVSLGGCALIITIGFASYLLAKYSEYGKMFDVIKFIIGTPVCDSLK